MHGKETRKALTDEWHRCGVKNNQYALLTDIITKEWSGFTTRQYKEYKGLKKENPTNIEQNKRVAKTGGSVAKETRIRMEKQLGRSIVSSSNAKGLQSPDEIKEIDEQ